MGTVLIDHRDALRDMAEDDDQSNVEFAAAFQGKVHQENAKATRHLRKGNKPQRHPSREATTTLVEEVERVFIPKSAVPWDIIDATVRYTTNAKLRRVLMAIRSTPSVKRGRGNSVPIDVTDAEIVAFHEFVAKCVETRSYSYGVQKAMHRFVGRIQ